MNKQTVARCRRRCPEGTTSLPILYLSVVEIYERKGGDAFLIQSPEKGFSNKKAGLTG